jgi:histidyl-tRNA synthetase
MKDPALELAYAASDAYRYEAENLAVIDEVLDQLGERAEITPLEFLKLREALHVVLTANRTAPGVMKIMAMADAARISRLESSSAAKRRERRFWKKHLDKTLDELTQLLASTLDALAEEQY